MAVSDNKEKGEKVFIDIERGSNDARRSSSSQLEQESFLPNERSNLGADAESATKLLCVYHKSGNHTLVKMEGKDVEGILMAPAELIRGRLREYMKHGADGKSEDSATPEHLLQDRDQELEEYAKFAYLTLGLSYGVLYSLLSASLRRTGDKREVMMGVRIWSILVMLLFFLSFYIRCPVGIFKIIRIIMAGLLFISSIMVFVLLQITL